MLKNLVFFYVFGAEQNGDNSGTERAGTAISYLSFPFVFAAIVEKTHKARLVGKI